MTAEEYYDAVDVLTWFTSLNYAFLRLEIFIRMANSKPPASSDTHPLERVPGNEWAHWLPVLARVSVRSKVLKQCSRSSISQVNGNLNSLPPSANALKLKDCRSTLHLNNITNVAVLASHYIALIAPLNCAKSTRNPISFGHIREPWRPLFRRQSVRPSPCSPSRVSRCCPTQSCCNQAFRKQSSLREEVRPSRNHRICPSYCSLMVALLPRERKRKGCRFEINCCKNNPSKITTLGFSNRVKIPWGQ